MGMPRSHKSRIAIQLFKLKSHTGYLVRNEGQSQQSTYWEITAKGIREVIADEQIQ